MVQKVVTEQLDDLDGSPAVETVRFGYAGREYEIDLSEEHANELDEGLAPYIERARRANGGKPSRGGGPRGSGVALRSCGRSGSGRPSKACG